MDWGMNPSRMDIRGKVCSYQVTLSSWSGSGWRWQPWQCNRAKSRPWAKNSDGDSGWMSGTGWAGEAPCGWSAAWLKPATRSRTKKETGRSKPFQIQCENR